MPDNTPHKFKTIPLPEVLDEKPTAKSKAKKKSK